MGSQTGDIMTSRDEIPLDDLAILQLFKDNLLNHTLNGNSGGYWVHENGKCCEPLFQFPCHQTECPPTIASCQTWSLSSLRTPGTCKEQEDRSLRMDGPHHLPPDHQWIHQRARAPDIWLRERISEVPGDAQASHPPGRDIGDSARTRSWLSRQTYPSQSGLWWLFPWMSSMIC